MSTYDASKFVKTRKPHKCDKCGTVITKGSDALAYKLGLKWTAYIHYECALPTYSGYSCAALDERRRAIAA